MKKKRLFLILLKMAIPNLLTVNTHDDMSCSISYRAGDSIGHLECSLKEYETAANYQGKKFAGFMDQLILNT
jgi:hypothetical protein